MSSIPRRIFLSEEEFQLTDGSWLSTMNALALGKNHEPRNYKVNCVIRDDQATLEENVESFWGTKRNVEKYFGNVDVQFIRNDAVNHRFENYLDSHPDEESEFVDKLNDLTDATHMTDIFHDLFRNSFDFFRVFQTSFRRHVLLYEDDEYNFNLSRDCLVGSLEALKQFEHDGNDSEAHAEIMSEKYREEFFKKLLRTISEDDLEARKVVEFLGTLERIFNLINQVMSFKQYDNISAVLENYNWRDTFEDGNEMVHPVRCLDSLKSVLQIQRENFQFTPQFLSTAFMQAEKHFLHEQSDPYFPSLEQCQEWMDDAARGETDPVTVVVPRSSQEVTLQFSALPPKFPTNWF